MISILVVDDDASKRTKIVDAIMEAAGSTKVNIIQAENSHDAYVRMERHDCALLILDIQLPLRSGAEPSRDGGMRVLQQLLKAGARFRRPEHIIGLTAYDDLVTQFRVEFQIETWQLLHYQSSDDSWRSTLVNLVIHILAGDAQRKHQHPDLDLAIVTALKTVELESILDLPGAWKEERIDGDDTIYHRGVFKKGKKSLRVVAAAAIEMGSAAAACLTMKVILAYRPRYLAMSGITAGIKGAFGDILIADQSWDYGSGKITSKDGKESNFLPAPNYIAVDGELKEKLQNFCTQNRGTIGQIREEWPATTPVSALQTFIGPIATGASVVENEAVIASIKAINNKVIGVEMETYGVYLACRTAPGFKPRCFSAKSVCDFGVPPKNDDHQRYAAFTSARFILQFALDQLAS